MKTEKTLAELIEIIPDAALMIDEDGSLVLLNNMLAKMFGYEKQELLGQSLDILLPEDIREYHHQHVVGFFKSGKSRPMGQGFRFLGQRRSGEKFFVEIMLSHVRLDGEEYALAFVRDNTFAKQTEDKIRRELERERLLALTDHLTGLGNRRAFTHELEQDIEELKEHGWHFAVGFIDLDDFKVINDTYGHEMGDRILQDVATSIRQGCRGTDFVARIGGDEFATIHPGATLQDAVQVLDRVRTSIVAEMKEKHWPVTLSLGVCHCDDATREYTVAELLRAADEAMYEAKQQGKNQIKIASL